MKLLKIQKLSAFLELPLQLLYLWIT